MKTYFQTEERATIMIEEIHYKGHTIRIEPDDDAESPRDWDNVGTILYTSSRYTLGDKRLSADEIRDISHNPENIALPVCAYIHSGIRLSISPFSCPWDSGQCGIIYCTKVKAVKEWGDKYTVEHVKEVLNGEIEAFNSYLSGDVAGYVIDGPLCEDSCWGFYPDEQGEYTYAIDTAKEEIDRARDRRAQELKAERLDRRLAREQHLALI